MPRGGLDWAHQPSPYKEFPVALKHAPLEAPEQKGQDDEHEHHGDRGEQEPSRRVQKMLGMIHLFRVSFVIVDLRLELFRAHGLQQGPLMFAADFGAGQSELANGRERVPAHPRAAAAPGVAAGRPANG